MSFKFLTLFLLIFFNSARIWGQEKAELDTVPVQNLRELIITATRQEESLLKAPVSVEKLNLQAIRQSAHPGFFEAIQNLKGIQVITPSLGFRVINARGFAHTTNVRFVQLVDGVDNQAPHIGAPIANSLGPNDLDILTVEIIPGSASALYGMNAINGIAQFITKNPFDFQGISINQKIGVNNVNSPDSKSTAFSETNLRIAEVWGGKWGIKLNGTWIQGTDWHANNQQDLNPLANNSTQLTGEQNPGADRVNQYGDEAPNRRTLTLNGIRYVVSRTGYAEKEVADYGLKNLKGDVSVFFRPKKHLELSYTFRATQQNNIYQRTNRFRFDDYLTQQHAFLVHSPSIQFRTYLTSENTGNSYNIRSMAENIDRSFKTDSQWFSDFSRHYSEAVANGSPVEEAMNLSRALSDEGRIQPETPEMAAKIEELRTINNWDVGAALRVKAKLFHTEFQQDLSSWLFPTNSDVQVMYGLDYRTYMIIPDGNYFINPVEAGENLRYWKTGGFVQASKTFWEDRLKINTVLRLEKNQYFEPKLNPRLAIVYTSRTKQSFRFSVQNGYRFPSIFEGFSNINSGGRKRIGGLPIMSSGIFENSYTQASISLFQRAVQSDVNTKGLSLDEAISKNETLLKKSDYTYLEPEQVTSLEWGYRAELAKGKLALDADFYVNQYRNLMAQLDANVPKTSNGDSLGYYFLQNSTQDLYRLWTNSKTVSVNYGGSLGVSYNFFKNFQLGGNFTYAKLSRQTRGDGLEDGFNTPEWNYNLSLGNPSVYKSLGFQVNFRQQAGFLWESALATGWVEGYSTLDAQLTAGIFKNSGSLKIGATNAFNRYYYSFLGGPAIGGFYYTSVTFEF
ncbi:TonB-dependent receptor [Algoriphagus lacus]|uniref:TonB-dependent receptor n=1 Tax=Algoriphagus lacus TaxID=2056311 RepID=A0A418PRB7_9BACT|nr:TonB-dependent receptor [Algoriphagus lacus]RIW15131.1 TonB-dependent receptor [Algoriphagus lacus]